MAAVAANGIECVRVYLLELALERVLLPWHWFAILQIRATCCEARDHVGEYLRPLMQSNDTRPLRGLQDRLIQAELNLMAYFAGLHPSTAIVAGGFALNRLLQQHSTQRPCWKDGDIDVFIRCTPRDTTPRTVAGVPHRQDLEYLESIELQTEQFFEARGYSVDIKWIEGLRSHVGYPTPLYTRFKAGYPLRAEGFQFTTDELEGAIALWIDGHAGDPEVTPLLPELSRVVEHLPPVRRGREWVVASGGTAQIYCKVSSASLGVTHELNLIGMTMSFGEWSAEDMPLMRSVAHDFDLAHCGVCLDVKRCLGVGVEYEYTFGGESRALHDASHGSRCMRLSRFAFEPILPYALSSEQVFNTAQGRRQALELSVDRQMKRIAKYLRRGFTWPNVPSVPRPEFA